MYTHKFTQIHTSKPKNTRTYSTHIIPQTMTHKNTHYDTHRITHRMTDTQGYTNRMTYTD